MPAKTCSASASCGTRSGETKARTGLEDAGRHGRAELVLGGRPLRQRFGALFLDKPCPAFARDPDAAPSARHGAPRRAVSDPHVEPDPLAAHVRFDATTAEVEP